MGLGVVVDALGETGAACGMGGTGACNKSCMFSIFCGGLDALLPMVLEETRDIMMETNGFIEMK